MKLLLVRVILLCLLTIGSLQLPAQQIDSMMNLYRDNFPQEKIHVHFDKSYYIPGETIWFKAYLMSGAFLSEISRNFYAELLNEQGVLLQRIAAPVLNSSAASSFDLPASFAGQTVHFRAYTTWMLNFDTSFIYEKDIRIISKAALSPPTVPNVSSLQFFPEGGDLVAGLESVLAFKANDIYGYPVNVSGYIRTAAGKKVQDFKSRHDGLGTLVFTPVKGEKYTAVWKDSTNKEKTTPLPSAKDAGIVLSVKNSPGSVGFMVRKTLEGENLQQVYVIAHMDQQMVYKARINLSQITLNSGRIPVEQLPTGILQVTLFNSLWQPVAERIVFVNKNDYIFDAYLSTGAKNLNKRGKNVLEIEVPDTLLTNLSLSVTDATANVPRENEDNIYSRLLLTGDLKGYVHDPGYYFASFADSVVEQLDAVMLTHGWRRFNWEDLAKGKVPQIRYPIENYVTLHGSLLGVDPSRLSKENSLNLILQYKDSSSEFVTVPLEAGGKFTATGMVFYDTAKLYYQLNKDRGKSDNLVLNIENDLWKDPASLKVPFRPGMSVFAPDNAALARNRDIFEQTVSMESARQKKAKMLQEVVIRGRSRSEMQKLEDRYTSGMFKGGDGYNFDVSSDPTAMGSMSLFNYLQGKVPGLTISNAQSTQPSLSWRGGPPALFLNEMQTDANALASTPMSDVAYIKVLRPPFMGAIGGGANGAIAVYTKRGGEARNENFVGLSKVTITGFSPVKEFYSPNYAQSNPLHDLDDLRTTLFWSPYLFTDKDKKRATVSFYNNDISKKLRVIVEGVNALGKLTRIESIIE